jgi:hypothetical protein
MQPMNAVDVPVERLGLAGGCLARVRSAGLLDARTLASKSASDLSAIGLSVKQIESVRSCLDHNGLALSTEPSIALRSELSYKEKPELVQGTLIDVTPRPSEPVPSPTSGELIIEATDDTGNDLIVPDFSASELFEDAAPRKRRSRVKTDDERALRSAAKAESFASSSPTRDHARVIALRETITMDVESAAFLYNVSKDAIYDSIKRGVGAIPHRHVGKRIIIPTRPVFAELGLD